MKIALSGGLGNQLFQIAYLAANSPEKELIVDIGLLNPVININGIPESFCFKLEDRTYKIDVTKKLRFEIWLANKILKISSKNTTKYLQVIMLRIVAITIGHLTKIFFAEKFSFPLGSGFDPNFQPQKESVILGCFQSSNWFEEKNIKLKKVHFILESPSQKLLNLIEESQSERPTIVHVRLGDYLELNELNVVNRDYFYKAIRYLDERNKCERIWLFTNDVEQVEAYIPIEFRNRIRIFGPDELNSGETLELMSYGYSYVISNSTFGWWGAFRTKNDNAVVCYPRKWFKSACEPNKIVPSDWIGIKN